MEKQQTISDLTSLIFELRAITSKDVLADCSEERANIVVIDAFQSSWSLQQSNPLQQILTKSTHNKRQEAIETLMLAMHTIQWEFRGKTIETPVLLFPVQFTLDKVQKVYQFTCNENSFFINPFLKDELFRLYEIELDALENSSYSQYLINFYELLSEKGIQYTQNNTLFLGNFHPHRFHILRDLASLQTVEHNPLVAELLGNSHEIVHEKLLLPKENLYPSDEDQEDIFALVATGNTVIQGPPGTGKSQVLTNLLGKLLLQDGKQLVVSEKKVALEVLFQKLKFKNLAAFVFQTTDKTSAKDFVQQLKESWLFLENIQLEPQFQTAISEQLLQQLQLQIDKLTTRDLIGGIDLLRFKQLKDHYTFEGVNYQSNVPAIDEWLTHKPTIETILAQQKDATIFSLLQQKTYKNTTEFHQELTHFLGQFNRWKKEFELNDRADLSQLIRQASRCVILENQSFKAHQAIFEKKTALKSFRKLRKEYLQTEKALIIQREKFNHWETLPTELQVEQWKTMQNGSWFMRRKLNKALQAFDIHAASAPSVFENLTAFYALQHAKNNLEIAFLTLGIEQPAHEIESLHYIFEQLSAENENELNSVFQLSPETRQQIIAQQTTLQSAERWLHFYFHLNENTPILENLFNIDSHWTNILSQQQALALLPASIYQVLQQFQTLEAIEAQILYSNWHQFSSLFPALSTLDGEKFQQQLEAIIYEETRERDTFVQQLHNKRKAQFEQYHTLLRTPSAKLNASEKTLKANLKKGKSLLVKEFAKSKQHLSIRELCDSEAANWIALLLPIWMMTPSQVAQHLPLTANDFDTVIFDEASQIPLANALGSLQRAKKVVVAGDEQQMAPSSYFSASTDPVDLLHQSSFYWKNGMLKHHYRSVHPALISFSNRYFYHDELKTFPSAKHQAFPIHAHYLPNGRFIDRKNQAEAKALANEVSRQLNSTDKIGIVAFSKEQLNCIWTHFSPSDQAIITERIEENNLFFKSLEEVQGDECDRLYISIGYGKNENDEFHLRFGPLNQHNGSKRLNVLFSRAKNEMHIFTSIEASDFPISDNESIQLLRLFLQQISTQKTSHTLAFPYDLHPIIDKENLIFENSYCTIPSAKSLKNLHQTLTSRGWNVTYRI